MRISSKQNNKCHIQATELDPHDLVSKELNEVLETKSNENGINNNEVNNLKQQLARN